jgi:ubiquinol oxidase
MVGLVKTFTRPPLATCACDAPAPSATPSPAAAPSPAGPARLTAAQLRLEHERTLSTPRRRYGLPARALFAIMDHLYGTDRSLSKFKVLEVVARVPYQAWENVAYVAVTHRYSRPGFARRIAGRLHESRVQQDNEQWHLLILEELVEATGRRESFVRHRVLPQVLAFAYYQLSWLLYALRPAWSYRLNADFEDHAEHEYALFVEEHPDLEHRRYDGLFADEYGRFDSLADLIRQIGYDERVHKEESLARMTEPRFR